MFPGVVIREDPKKAIAQKLDYMRWLREQMNQIAGSASRARGRGELLSLGKPYFVGELRHRRVHPSPQPGTLLEDRTGAQFRSQQPVPFQRSTRSECRGESGSASVKRTMMQMDWGRLNELRYWNGEHG